MKKLAIILLVLGVGVAGFAVWKVFLAPKPAVVEKEEEPVVELPVEKRPYLELVPRADGHEIKLVIDKIPVGTPTLEYELIYKVKDGRTLGVPGSVSLGGKTSLERNLLLGSCSSGKCRYDEGVETGTVTIKLRDAGGKLVGKAGSDFHLAQGGSEIEIDGFKFTGKLEKTAFYLAHQTLGLPQAVASGSVVAGPFGLFTGGSGKISGEVSISGDGIGEGSVVWFWDGSSWSKLGGQVAGNKISVKVTSVGTFAVVSP